MNIILIIKVAIAEEMSYNCVKYVAVKIPSFTGRTWYGIIYNFMICIQRLLKIPDMQLNQ